MNNLNIVLADCRASCLFEINGVNYYAEAIFDGLYWEYKYYIYSMVKNEQGYLENDILLKEGLVKGRLTIESFKNNITIFIASYFNDKKSNKSEKVFVAYFKASKYSDSQKPSIFFNFFESTAQHVYEHGCHELILDVPNYGNIWLTKDEHSENIYNSYEEHVKFCVSKDKEIVLNDLVKTYQQYLEEFNVPYTNVRNQYLHYEDYNKFYNKISDDMVNILKILEKEKTVVL